VIGIGHSAAGAEEIATAVDAGAKLSTHLGNGCGLLLHRHANPLWPQLADDHLSASFIGDGHHLRKEIFTVMVRAKGVQRSILISDSVALAGSPAGCYVTPVGGAVELSEDRRLSLVGTAGELLAGSASCLSECLAWAVFVAGVPLADAVGMAARNPSRLLPTSDSRPSDPSVRGRIRVGAPADLCIVRFDDETGQLQVESTVVGGEFVAGESGGLRSAF